MVKRSDIFFSHRFPKDRFSPSIIKKTAKRKKILNCFRQSLRHWIYRSKFLFSLSNALIASGDKFWLFSSYFFFLFLSQSFKWKFISLLETSAFFPFKPNFKKSLNEIISLGLNFNGLRKKKKKKLFLSASDWSRKIFFLKKKNWWKTITLTDAYSSFKAMNVISMLFAKVIYERRWLW